MRPGLGTTSEDLHRQGHRHTVGDEVRHADALAVDRQGAAAGAGRDDAAGRLQEREEVASVGRQRVHLRPIVKDETLSKGDTSKLFTVRSPERDAEKVMSVIKNTIGITTRVRIVAPDTLERSLGKAKRVYDKRPKG